MTSSNDEGSFLMIVLMTVNYPLYLFRFLLSRKVPLGAIWLSSSLRVSLIHEGLLLEEEGYGGGGSIGSIASSTFGIVSSSFAPYFLVSSSLSFLGIGKLLILMRAISSSKVTS